MDKPVSHMMQKQVRTVDIDDTVEKVESVLNLHKLSCVPVTDPQGHCFGVISSTDLIHFHALHKNAKRERAWELCMHKVVEVSPDMSIRQAGELMIRERIHHLIVTENRCIKGIVSSMDFVKEFVSRV